MSGAMSPVVTQQAAIGAPALGGEVVAVALTWRGRIGLFKRSASVGSDAGRWHCIAGYVDSDNSPSGQAARELYEETGLQLTDLHFLQGGPILSLTDRRGGEWRVHTFLASTGRYRLRLNWEHETYRWVHPHRIPRVDGQVDWLSHVLQALPVQELSGRMGTT